MKIIYSAGNRVGSSSQLFRFFNKVSNEHNIKIAAYINSSDHFSHINWTLDSFYNKYSDKKVSKLKKIIESKHMPRISVKEAINFLEDVDRFEPDLIISDGEQISALIAASLGVRLWYCSPLLLLVNMNCNEIETKYRHSLENTKRIISELPDAERNFIYSPFELVKERFSTKENYEWITPYHHSVESLEKDETSYLAVVPDSQRQLKIQKTLKCSLDNFSLYNNSFESSKEKKLKYTKQLSVASWVFTTGETSYLSDAIYNNVDKMCISPCMKDSESLLNASLVRAFGLGYEAGQIELLDKYSVCEIQRSLERGYNHLNTNKLRVQNTLDEKVKEICI
jgi:uncharacterized protein (TIGR00661 family)